MSVHLLSGLLSSKRRASFIIQSFGVTQKELAEKIGAHHQSVSDVVRGKRKTLWIRLAIAEALGVPLSELWPGEGYQRTSKRQTKS